MFTLCKLLGFFFYICDLVQITAMVLGHPVSWSTAQVQLRRLQLHSIGWAVPNQLLIYKGRLVRATQEVWKTYKYKEGCGCLFLIACFKNPLMALGHVTIQRWWEVSTFVFFHKIFFCIVELRPVCKGLNSEVVFGKSKPKSAVSKRLASFLPPSLTSFCLSSSCLW